MIKFIFSILLEMTFQTYLQKKIKENMKEWKKGRWVSQKQALAVSYSQARKHYSRKKNSKPKRKSKRSYKNV